MSNKRFLNIVISIVAISFIVYVFVDNTVKDDQMTYVTTNDEDNVEEQSGDLDFNNQNENSSSSAASLTKDEVGLLIGMYAPDFTLPIWGTDEEGSLSSFRGEIVVLNLWASWCPPCRREMPDLIKLHENYDGKGVKVVGVNMSTLEKSVGATDEFMNEFNVTFPNFVDHANYSANLRGMVETLYRVRSIPATYILDEGGRIQQVIRGEVNYEMLELQVEKILE